LAWLARLARHASLGRVFIFLRTVMDSMKFRVRLPLNAALVGRRRRTRRFGAEDALNQILTILKNALPTGLDLGPRV
jgi:hypothetical protein